MQYVADGDIGCDAPGTPRWHICIINQLPDDEIPAYMKAVRGVELKGKNVREQAIEVINGDGT